MKKVGIIKGDGIGPEIAESVIQIFKAAKVPIEFEEVILGEKALSKYNELTPQKEIAKISELKTILKSPLMTPIGEGYASINVFLRKRFNLDLNIRPSYNIEGIDTPFKKFNILVMRENIQGMYVGDGQESDGENAISVSKMNKKKLELFFHRSFTEAIKRSRKKITIVHKANILKSTSGLFLKTGYEIAKNYPELEVDDMIVDATAMNLVKNPIWFDTIITSNLFGDILSDLCAGLMGGLGVASGANIGSDISIFEAVHGTAPDIVGLNLANPTALLLSGCLMLEHLGLYEYSEKIKINLFSLIKDKSTRTKDLGGILGTKEFTQEMIKKFN